MQRYGEQRVFMDVSAIGPGEDFAHVVERDLATCEVLIALIGPRWLTIADDQGVPRLMKEKDLVRIELQTALARPGISVIPALVGGALNLEADALPEDLRLLARRNSIELSDSRWSYDCHRLCTKIDEVLGIEATPPGDADTTPRRTPETGAVPTATSAEAKADEPAAADPYERLRAMRSSWNLLGSSSMFDMVPCATPLVVEVGNEWIPQITDDKGELDFALKLLLWARRGALQTEYGIQIPGARIRGTTDIPSHVYIISINEIPLVSGRLFAHSRYLSVSPDILATMGIHAEPLSLPDGSPGSLVPEAAWEEVERHGHTMLTPVDYLVAHIERVVRVNLREFLGMQEVHDMLAGHAPELLPRVKDGGHLSRLQDVMANLLEEGVPVTAVQAICTSVLDDLDHGSHVLDALVRVRALPALRGQLAGNREGNLLFQLAPEIVGEITNKIVWGDDSAFLTIEPERLKAINAAVDANIGKRHDAVLIVDDPIARRAVRKMVELEFPDLHVLANQELLPAFRAQPRSLVRVS